MIIEYNQKIITQKKPINIKGKIKAWVIDIDNNSKKSQIIHEEDLFSYKKNLNPTSYIYDLANTAVNTAIDLRYKYVSLSTAYDSPSKTDTLFNEIGRVVPTSITKVNNKITIDSTFGVNDANTLVANITAFTDKKNFTLSDKTGLQVGDRVRFFTPNNATGEERKITYISPSSNAITIDKDLSENPSTSTANNFKQMISRIHLVYGSTATLSLNTGSGASIAQLLSTKLSTQNIYTRHEIEFLGS